MFYISYCAAAFARRALLSHQSWKDDGVVSRLRPNTALITGGREDVFQPQEWDCRFFEILSLFQNCAAIVFSTNRIISPRGQVPKGNRCEPEKRLRLF